MKKLLLLIDFSNLFHRGFHVHSNLSFKGTPTGGAYGFVSQIATLVNKYHPTTIAICDDLPPYFRSFVFPAYKAKRKGIVDVARAEAFAINRKISTGFLDILGWPFYRIPGLEADDIIAALAKNHEKEYEKVCIVSADADLWQLLDQRNLFILTGVGKSKKEVDLKFFLNANKPLKFACDWAYINAITGGHNGLPGVAGVGIQKALGFYAYVQNLSLPNGRRISKKDIGKIGVAERLIQKSVPLAVLPYPNVGGWDKLRLPVATEKTYSLNDLVRFLVQFGIKFTPYMASAFDK